jgi:Aldose 1-epimerase
LRLAAACAPQSGILVAPAWRKPPRKAASIQDNPESARIRVTPTLSRTRQARRHMISVTHVDVQPTDPTRLYGIARGSELPCGRRGQAEPGALRRQLERTVTDRVHVDQPPRPTRPVYRSWWRDHGNRYSDRHGKQANIVLGSASLSDYERLNGTIRFGALIGRHANRIASGRFELNGRTWQLPTNDGAKTLHGGPNSFDSEVWAVRPAAAGLDRAAYGQSRKAPRATPGRHLEYRGRFRDPRRASGRRGHHHGVLSAAFELVRQADWDTATGNLDRFVGAGTCGPPI